ncbi:MAG: alkaline phosphatase [Arachnia sp.]
MLLFSTRPLAVVLTASALVAASALAPSSAAADSPTIPRNVIVLIGDGMGYNQVDLANEVLTGKTHYQLSTGADGTVRPAGTNARRPTQGFQSWDLVGASTHWADGPAYDPSKAWSSFRWVLDSPTDSAAAGTAMATGTKTLIGRIGKDPKGKDLENLAQRAKALGKSAGVVSSVSFSHATPASYSAHDSSRNDYQSIAHEQLTGPLDVVIGAGHPYFTDDHRPTATGTFDSISQADWELLVSGRSGFTFAEDLSEFERLTSGPTPSRLFGVPQVRSTLQQARSAGAARNDVPELATLATAALNVLDEDKDGLFLMVEGGAIDKAGHANQTSRNAEETVEFFGAIDAVVDWVETNSSWDETLVVVTADHETGYLMGPASGSVNPIVDYPQVSWNTKNHTNQLVPFFFKGAGADVVRSLADARDPLRGAYLDNTELATWLLNTAWTRPFTSTHAPTVTGTARVGSTLTAAVEAWTPSASTTYRWLRDGKGIAGATSKSYTLTKADAGREISVRAWGSRAGYTPTSRTSKPVVVAKVLSATPTPAVSGTAKVGSKLTVKVGTWQPAPVKVGYQWLRDGKAISKATKSSYTVTGSDAGKKISVKVTGSRSGYVSVSRTSKSVSVAKVKASVKVSVPSSVKRGKQATVKVSVSSAATGKPVGTVKVTVNGKTVKKSVSSSVKGKVSVTLPKVSKKGTYSVKVSFVPSGSTAKSTSSSSTVTKTLRVV